MTVTAETWRATGQRYIDLGYGYGFCDRCGGSCHEFDCSGLQCHISNETHITQNFCTSSFVMSQLCWDAGLFMTAEQAEADSGPDVFYAVHGADEGRTDDGSKPNGASGHIVTIVRVRDANGHTIGFYTIEAMGRRYGCVNGTYFGRAWTGRYRIPGVTNAPPPSPPKLKERDMIHLPGTGTPAGRRRFAQVSVDGLYVGLWNGGKVQGMDGVHSGDDPDMRRFYPKNADGSAAATPTLPLIGVCRNERGDLLVAGRKDGSTYEAKIITT